MELTLASLPNDALQEIINAGNNFPGIVNLEQTSSRFQGLLECKTLTVNPMIPVFVEDPPCPLTPEQITRLEFLNKKYNLRVSSPLTFAKLHRAYLRSSNNPQCQRYASLMDCLKSAVKAGDITQFVSLEESWKSISKKYSDTAISLPRFYNKLGTLAYKYNHLKLGDFIFTLPTRRLFNLKYERYQAHIRQILRPHKVLTSREIRDLYSTILYSPEVSDADKQKIWAAKYDLREFVPDFNNEFHLAILVKLGLIDSVETDQRSTLLILASHSANHRLLSSLGLKLTMQLNFEIVNLAKRGYFQTILSYSERNSLGEPDVDLDGVYKSSGRFTLKQFLQLNAGLLASVYQTGANPEDIIKDIILTQNPNLYFEFLQVENVPIQDYAGDAFQHPGMAIKSLPIINDILKRIKSVSRADGRTAVRFLLKQYRLFVKIWKVYGRQKFEDSLIYLYSNFETYEDPKAQVKFQNELLGETLVQNAIGLLTYLFGYEIVDYDDSTSQYKLLPLRSPGIILLEAQRLNDYLRTLGAGGFLALDMMELMSQLKDLLNYSNQSLFKITYLEG